MAEMEAVLGTNEIQAAPTFENAPKKSWWDYNIADPEQIPLYRPEKVVAERHDGKAVCLYIPTNADGAGNEQKSNYWIATSQCLTVTRDEKKYVIAVTKLGAKNSGYLKASATKQYRHMKDITQSAQSTEAQPAAKSWWDKYDPTGKKYPLGESLKVVEKTGKALTVMVPEGEDGRLLNIAQSQVTLVSSESDGEYVTEVSKLVAKNDAYLRRSVTNARFNQAERSDARGDARLNNMIMGAANTRQQVPAAANVAQNVAANVDVMQ